MQSIFTIFFKEMIAAEGSILIFTVLLWYPVLLAELYRVDVISIFALIQGGPGGAIILQIFTEWYVTCHSDFGLCTGYTLPCLCSFKFTESLLRYIYLGFLSINCMCP